MLVSKRITSKRINRIVVSVQCHLKIIRLLKNVVYKKKLLPYCNLSPRVVFLHYLSYFRYFHYYHSNLFVLYHFRTQSWANIGTKWNGDTGAENYFKWMHTMRSNNLFPMVYNESAKFVFHSNWLIEWVWNDAVRKGCYHQQESAYGVKRQQQPLKSYCLRRWMGVGTWKWLFACSSLKNTVDAAWQNKRIATLERHFDSFPRANQTSSIGVLWDYRKFIVSSAGSRTKIGLDLAELPRHMAADIDTSLNIKSSTICWLNRSGWDAVYGGSVRQTTKRYCVRVSVSNAEIY